MFFILNEIYKFFFPPKKLTADLAQTVMNAKSTTKPLEQVSPEDVPVSKHPRIRPHTMRSGKRFGNTIAQK